MDTYGDADLCGRSKDSDEECSGNVNFDAARDFCQAMHARLCSVEELLRDEARGTGCSYDSQLVWSSTVGK